MTPEQINAVYQDLVKRTGDPDNFLHRLELVKNDFNAVDAVLFLPMYSMGIGQAGIHRRINVLRAMPFTVQDAVSGKCTVREIEHLKVSGEGEFGMPNRLEELFDRARQIADHGEAKLSTILEPRENWSLDDLVEPFTLLYRFTGVADKAALHILMNLGWGVVKPDRHICRFLSRLGGPWKRYFPTGETDELRAALTLPFVKDWRDTCATFASSKLPAPSVNKQVQLPSVAQLSSRQVDILIMWYAQDRAKDEHEWRPKPICGKVADCKACSVPECEARKASG